MSPGALCWDGRGQFREAGTLVGVHRPLLFVSHPRALCHQAGHLWISAPYINKDISSALAVTRARSFFWSRYRSLKRSSHPWAPREIARRSLHTTDPGTASRTPTFRDYSQAQTSLALREALEGVDDQSDARTPEQPSPSCATHLVHRRNVPPSK